MNKITRSSKKWKLPKKKLNEKTIFHKDFEIMSDGQHCYYLCKKEIQLADKTHTRCEYVYRKDYVSHPDDLNHTCFYLDGDITKYFSLMKSNEQNIPQNNLNDLQKMHLVLVGQLNLSLENAVNESLYELISEAIKLGQRFPTSNPAHLYPKISRTTFTQYFISLENEIYNDALAKYKEIGNVALAIDAGKEGSKFYFDIILTNAIHNVKPLIYKAIEYFDGTYESYCEKISNAIDDLEKSGFKLSGIVADGLRVQRKAVKHCIEEHGSRLLSVPCSCHCLNLAILDYLKKLGVSIDCIETFALVFNTKTISSRLKITCPSRCYTRWSIFFDICSWMVIHYDSIEQFLNQQSNLTLRPFHKDYQIISKCIKAIRKWAPLLTILLLPFKIVSEKLEGDSVTSGYTYGYSHSATILLEQLSRESAIEKYSMPLITCVQDRLDFSESRTLQRLLFHLTPRGRQVYIKCQQEGQTIEENKLIYTQNFPLALSQKSQDVYCKAKELFEKRNEHFAKLKEALDQEQLFTLDQEDQYDDYSDSIEESSEPENVILNGIKNNKQPQNNEEDDDDEDEDEDEEIAESSSSDDDADDYLSTEIYFERESIYESEDNMEKMIDFDLEGQIILDYAINLDLDYDKATKAYSAWMEPTDSMLTTNMKANIRVDDINGTWQFFRKCPEFRDLAVIALQFLSIPASESSAERMFYKQRRIITKQRVNTSNSLQIARLTYMTCM